MWKSTKLQGLLVLALTGLLGYGAATGPLASLLGADKEKSDAPPRGHETTAAPGSPAATTDKDYQVPFQFTGKLNKLTLKIEPPVLTPEDIKKLAATRSGPE
jgi:hypothetical protein